MVEDVTEERPSSRQSSAGRRRTWRGSWVAVCGLRGMQSVSLFQDDRRDGRGCECGVGISFFLFAVEYGPSV